MGSLQHFLENMDWQGLLQAAFSAASALICLTVHELCHGLAAYRLGDPTAKNAGRLTLNPLRHVDPLGLLLMLTAHVGWAKPVPVDLRYFKRPKFDMALTALAGPASNFLLSWVFLLLARGLYTFSSMDSDVHFFLLRALFDAALLSVGLGIFNLIPVPPLDGSRVFTAFFPDSVYYAVMRAERYILPVMLGLVWLGVLNTPLSFLMLNALRGLCAISGVPYDFLRYCLF